MFSPHLYLLYYHAVRKCANQLFKFDLCIQISYFLVLLFPNKTMQNFLQEKFCFLSQLQAIRILYCTTLLPVYSGLAIYRRKYALHHAYPCMGSNSIVSCDALQSQEIQGNERAYLWIFLQLFTQHLCFLLTSQNCG